MVVGPTGSDVTVDGGKIWHGFSNVSLDAVECLCKQVRWASGPKGVVARLNSIPL